MHLVSRRPQTVRVAGRRIEFAEGETIHTENSYKYSVSAFQSVARASGWRRGPGLDRPGAAILAAPAVEPAVT